MKNIFIAFFFLLNPFYTKSQTDESRYKVYTGKVGNLSATLHLHEAGKSYSGYIWFDQNQWPMPIYSSEKIAKTDSTNIFAGSGPISLNLTGTFTGENFFGMSVLQKEGSGSKKAAFQLHVNAGKDFATFGYFLAQDSASLLPKIKNESTCRYTSATIWPTGNTSIDASLKKQIRIMLSMPATATEPGKWLMNETKKAALAWKKENSKLSPKEASDMGLSLSVEEENRVMVMYENEFYITLANYTFSYSGGAHGNYGTTLSVVSKKSGIKMQLADVVNAAGIKLLPALLEQVARFQYDARNNKPLDQNNFLVKKIEPTRNFYITSSGIGFLYAPYEIRSFADGDVNLLIPFTTVKSYLQPGFTH